MARFIGEPIAPSFDDTVVVRRLSTLHGFTWNEQFFPIAEVLRNWRESSPPRWRRRGKRASLRWHVSTLGRDYFRVRVADGRIFELFYDRQMLDNRLSGRWVLWRELDADEIT